MSVYVDIMMDCLLNQNWHYSQSCHMIADTEQELVAFAKQIGLKPEWIQRKRLLHFDLTASKRMVAIKKGAIELERKMFSKKAKEINKERLSDDKNNCTFSFNPSLV